jgi:hypothetical protein
MIPWQGNSQCCSKGSQADYICRSSQNGGSDDKSCELFHEQRQPSKDMQIRWIPKKCQDFLCTRGIIKKNMFIFSTRTFDVGVGSGGMEGNSIVS